MGEKAEKLISDFSISGWKTPNIYERLFELVNKPQEIYSFSKNFLISFEKGATLFNDSLSYIEREQFDQLIRLALDILKQQKNENAEAVISYASLQFPELLHEHLVLIFELKPNELSYYADYPWRHLSTEKIRPFKDKLKNSSVSLSDRQKLFSCLLETRDLKTVEFAYQFAIDNNLFNREDIKDYLTRCLESVGFTLRDGRIESYCPNPVYHFCFPSRYFSSYRPVHSNKTQHPTWKLIRERTEYEFGGIIEEDENNPYMHIITFEPIPENFKVSDLEKLTLGMHIRELNEFGAVFYQHDNFGLPQKINEVKEIEIHKDAPIRQTKVSFARTPERWQLQCWGSSNGRENLFRLGGEPTWIQGAEVLTCPVCHRKMDFLMQLDTDLPDKENGEVYFGSGGICYVFWCDQSKVSGYLMQCT
ncbi:MAG: hypothetical protein ACTHLE_14385 [Agriterribacter sp.]